MRLFLFDVDGTLIWAHGVGRTALAQAMTAVYGTPPAYEDYDTRGKTDPRIVFDVMHAAGVPDDVISARLPACFEAYVRYLHGLIDDGHPVQAMPGIPGLVRALSAREDALVGLLTGNIEPGARAKLRPTGLLPHFRVGAFGSDSADRRRLPAIARERAHALTGHDFAYRQISIIGDTPLDVDCAHACGARSVAVATGQHAYDELAGCAPDLLFADFSDVNAALLSLMGTS
jgi:phosphoglycolate phosphatase-like HAD superfamily hydrolase